jgi:hypothetical protein
VGLKSAKPEEELLHIIMKAMFGFVMRKSRSGLIVCVAHFVLHC